MMEEKKNEKVGIIKRIILHYKKYAIMAGLLAIALVVIAISVAFCTGRQDEEEEIVLEETPIQIEAVRPKGEIVVCSSIIEDYASVKKTEKTLGLIETQHHCVQILKMKCSYKIDLEKVEYELEDSAKIIWVKLPELEYNASLQDSPFISDDEEYWKDALPSTNKLKAKVAKQIEKRFCTSTNKQKGERYAEEAISKMLSGFGYEVKFVRTLEKKDE